MIPLSPAPAAAVALAPPAAGPTPHECVLFALQVTADAKFVDLGADSLDTVEIMMALEEKFDIQLDEEGAEKISTVQEAADLIAAQIDK